MILANNIHFSIGAKTILKDINLTLNPGKIYTFLGPNGAGKSTLLKCLTGNLCPDIGYVTLCSKRLSDYRLNELAKYRAVLSQSTQISFPFKAHEIVMMGRNPHTTLQKDSDNAYIVDEVLTCVDALALKDRLFPTLSGGEQQRIQLARVLAQIWQKEEAVLFLDEPTSALDLKHQHQVFQLLKNLAKEKRWVIVAVIHDLNLAKVYSDAAILMKNGQIYASGDTKHSLNPVSISEVFEIPEELAII